MKLQIMSDQGGSFDEYYADVKPSSYLRKSIQQTRDLLHYLDQNVDGPPRWVTISHYVLFYLSEVDHWDPCKAQVFVCPKEYGYEIKYRSALEIKSEADWEKSFTFLYAHSIEEAGDMVSSALALAITNPPGRFPPAAYKKSPR